MPALGSTCIFGKLQLQAILLSLVLALLCAGTSLHTTVQEHRVKHSSAFEHKEASHHSSLPMCVKPHNHHAKRRSQIVTSMLDHNFTTPEVQLRKGLTYVGSNWRLRKAIHKLLSEPEPELWIGAIGGSITKGPNLLEHERWFSILQAWLVSWCDSPDMQNLEESFDHPCKHLRSDVILNDAPEVQRHGIAACLNSMLSSHGSRIFKSNGGPCTSMNRCVQDQT